VLLNAEEVEIHGRVGMLHRRVPFVGPSHRDGDGISRFDINVHVAASGCGMIHAAGVHAGGLHGNGLSVRGSPVEDAVIIILRVRDCGEDADEYRAEDRKMLHTRSICRVQAGA